MRVEKITLVQISLSEDDALELAECLASAPAGSKSDDMQDLQDELYGIA